MSSCATLGGMEDRQTAENDYTWRHCRWIEPHPANPVPGSFVSVVRATGKPGAVCETCGEGLTTDAVSAPALPASHYGPCVHCGHLRDEHGDNEACLRAGFYGNRYGCCETEHGMSVPPGGRS
jgi:hypothetical protein